jgi:hypothetical protein
MEAAVGQPVFGPMAPDVDADEQQEASGVRGPHFTSFRKDARIAALCRRLGIPTHAERVQHGYGSPVAV